MLKWPVQKYRFSYKDGEGHDVIVTSEEESLLDLLEHFKGFLNAVGFPYVTEIFYSTGEEEEENDRDNGE